MTLGEKTPIPIAAVPMWFKVVMTFCVVSWWYLFGRALSLPQQSYFGISYSMLLPILGGLVIVSSPLLVAIWRFPQSRLISVFYWLLRYMRELIAALALYGLLYYTIKLPLFNFKRGMPHLNTTLLISNSGGILLLNIVFFILFAALVEPANQTGSPLGIFERLSLYKQNLINRLNTAPSWILSLLSAILPTIVTCAIIYLSFHAHLSNYRPHSWNDATGYWLWVRSFSHYGFNVGYNVPNEMIAPAAFNHYGEGSPLYVYIYGFIGQLVGWSPQLPILINFGILAIVIYWFTRVLKFDSIQIILTTLVVLLFWPVLIYLPMSSQETLNQAIGFVLAALFYTILTKGVSNSYVKVMFVFFLFIATLIRVSWALLFFPLIFLCVDGHLLRKSIISVIVGSVLVYIAVTMTRYLVPPLQNSIFSMLGQVIKAGPMSLLAYFFDQLKYLLRVDQVTPHLVVVFELAIILIWSLIRLWKLVRKKLTPDATLQTRIMFDAYNVVALLLAGMLFYLVDGFSRIFIPPLLMIVLLQIAQKDYKPVSMILMLNVLFASSFLDYHGVNYYGNFDSVQTNYTSEIPQISRLQRELETYVVFDRETTNPWCNTLLIPLDYYDYRVTIVPPGIGISYIYLTPPNKAHLKSNYLLLDKTTYETLLSNENINAELLTSLSIGDLYHNLDSGCDIKFDF